MLLKINNYKVIEHFNSCINTYFTLIMTEMHPYTWSKEDVYTWLDWCRKEYALSEVPLEKFSMNGECKLKISTKIHIYSASNNP